MIIRRGNEGPGGFIAVVFSPLYDAIVNKVVLPATAAANMAPEPRSSSYETEVKGRRWIPVGGPANHQPELPS